MSMILCLAANTLYYPDGGGHLWVYLNWALGLHALGCSVIWLELANPFRPIAEQRACVAALTRPAPTREALGRAGYRAAMLFNGGPNAVPVADAYAVERVAMGPDTDLHVELAQP